MTDSETTVEELKQLVKRFCDERDWEQYHNPKDLAIGMVTESSELLDIFRFRDPEEVMSDPVRSEHVKQELSDVLYFVLRFAQMNGIDLSEELPRKIAMNAEKYPVESSKGRNLKYDELRSQLLPAGSAARFPLRGRGPAEGAVPVSCAVVATVLCERVFRELGGSGHAGTGGPAHHQHRPAREHDHADEHHAAERRPPCHDAVDHEEERQESQRHQRRSQQVRGLRLHPGTVSVM